MNRPIAQHLRMLALASGLLVLWVMSGFGLPPLILPPGGIISAPALLLSVILASMVGYTSGVVMLRGVYWQKVLAGGLLLFAALVSIFILLWVKQRADRG